MTSLPLLMVILLLVLVIGAQQWLHHRETTKWMRLLSFKEHIPQTIMEGSDLTPPGAPAEKRDTRRRISMAIPGAALFRRKEPDAVGKR